MRPFSILDVYLDAVDLSDLTPDGVDESLQIVTGPTSQIVVLGQFGPYFSSGNQKGRIEKVIFADSTITDMSTLQAASTASTEGLSAKQAELAEAAPRLAEEARAQNDPRDPTGANVIPGGNDSGAEVGPRSGNETKTKKDTGKKAKLDKQGKQEKKHDKRAK